MTAIICPDDCIVKDYIVFSVWVFMEGGNESQYEGQFFENYLKLRAKPDNFNDLLEFPAFVALLPDLTGKSVLDLGCGFGPHAKYYVEQGASRVTGVDISEKMLEHARKVNSDSKITYVHRDISDPSIIDLGKYDIVCSSLTIHYIEDLFSLFRNIAQVLDSGSVFLFSMEHPIATANNDEGRVNNLTDGYMLKHYSEEGLRKGEWIGAPIEKYHHKFMTVMNALIEAGFVIDKVMEPMPSKRLMKKVPRMKKQINRPSYLIVRSIKR